jgi:membrane associated rhomboid family serine protease
VSDAQPATDRDNYCYRHPKRQSYILCQRCGRTICSDCQTPAAVGVQCPECVREGRKKITRAPIMTRAVRSLRSRSDRPVVTYALLAICLVVYIVQTVLGPSFTSELVFYGPLALEQPWRMVTAAVAHASPLHILLNGYALYVMGTSLEPLLGRLRFIVLFVLTAIGGCVAVLLVAPDVPVLGASGAVFGMFGALFIILRRLGANATQLLIVIVLNLVIGFTISGVSWQGHIGGLVVGLALGAIYARMRGPRQQAMQNWSVGGIAAALAVLTVIGTLSLG